MTNKSGVDKNILFSAKSAIPRVYFKWSEDEHNEVIQVAWVDRKVVSMCSNAWSAATTTVSRLTSKKSCRGVSKEPLKAPRMVKRYNAGMGNVDSIDLMALQKKISWERTITTRDCWDNICWGLLDRAQVNCFSVFRERASPAVLEHSAFYERLMVGWYNCMYYQEHPTECRRMGKMLESWDPSSSRLPI
jgi:hypothetical protein